MEKGFNNAKRSKIIGIYLLFIGVVTLLKILFFVELKIIYIVLLLFFTISIDLLVRGIVIKRARGFLIPGITFGLTSLFLIIYISFLDNTFFNIKRIWPILGIFPSISLIIYYILTPRRDPKIIIPAIFLGLLSLIFIFYTCGIIFFKFKFVILLMIPFLIIFIGLYFIFGNEISSYRTKLENRNLHKKNRDKN